MGALDAHVQDAIFFVGKIKLASNIRELYWEWRCSPPFSSKKPPKYFQHQPIKFHYFEV